jgi:uncharacterized protein
MPVSPTYPGIYIQEAPSSTHTITAAPTNIAVFIGYTHPLKTKTDPDPRHPKAEPFQIFGFADYQRQFGGFVRSAAFATQSAKFGDMASAVSQFFLNGGTTAYIVSLNSLNGTLAALQPQTKAIGGITFAAQEVTDERFQMSVSIRPYPPQSPPVEPLADVVITYGPATQANSPPASPVFSSGPATVVETYRRVSLNPLLSDGKTKNPNYIETRIGTAAAPLSALVTVSVGAGASFPATASTIFFDPYLPGNTAFFSPTDYTAVLSQDTPLDKLQVFNLMVLPGVADTSVLPAAVAFCEQKYAFLIMDPPINDSTDGTIASYPHRIQDSLSSIPQSKNAALYFPYLLSPDPFTGAATNSIGDANEIPPGASVAGIFAATDLARGVWKAPAGFQATIKNVTGVVARGRMTDQRQGILNPLGINCLREFPNLPPVVFGSRTLVTATDEQWRYVPVRRMALFLEQTFYANLKWVIFEPNDQPLWTAITMSINAFMLGLFKQGAFQGKTPSEAYKVQCDSQTTTQADINNGIVNVVVGFAPLKPAEFVIITIAQLAGQTQTS